MASRGPSGRNTLGKEEGDSIRRARSRTPLLFGDHYTVFWFLGGHRQGRGSGELAWRWDRCGSGRTLGPGFQRLQVVGVQSAPPSAPRPAAPSAGHHQLRCALAGAGETNPSLVLWASPPLPPMESGNPLSPLGPQPSPGPKQQLLGLCDVQACSCPCVHAERSACLSLPTTASLWPPVHS